MNDKNKIIIKQFSIYLISNIISIAGGKFLIPYYLIPYWILFCVICGFFINKYTFKNHPC